MTKVLDDHDISQKATMFDQAQNVKKIAMWVQLKSYMALDRTFVKLREHESCLILAF